MLCLKSKKQNMNLMKVWDLWFNEQMNSESIGRAKPSFIYIHQGHLGMRSKDEYLDMLWHL